MQQTQTLHSRYNPKGEAERYIDSLSINKEIRYFILIEPGQGYLAAPLRKLNPEAKIIALHAQALPELSAEENISDAFWAPVMDLSLWEFLEQEIPETEAAFIKLIEWRPGLAVYGEAYHFLLKETVEFIKQADASYRTARQFGKRWFRNFFRNLGFISEVLCPYPFSFPLLISGAGPGLEETIPLLKKERENFLILSVSSSVPALYQNNIEPDLIISTDGGGWALLHLYECLRPEKDRKLQLAVSMSAALPSQVKNSSLLLISDGSLWQEIILRKLGIPYITLPQRGTVTAAALDLAFALSEEKVYLTGLDLGLKDIQTHVRPYSFDRIWIEKGSRFNPVYSQTFSRSRQLLAGRSHDIYASWFSRQLAAYPQRLHTLGPNNPLFHNIKISAPETFSQKAGNEVFFKIFSFAGKQNFAKTAALFLIESMENVQYESKLKEELSPFLLPQKTKASGDELEEAILGITKVYWEESNG